MRGDANQPPRRRLLQGCMPPLEIPVIAAVREDAYLATEARGATVKATRIALLGRDGQISRTQNGTRMAELRGTPQRPAAATVIMNP